MNKIILIAIVILLYSCQTQKKWLRKGYEKGWLSDSTIVKYDTIRGFSHDSIYFFDTLSKVDTIRTVKNGIKVVTVIKWKERQVKQIVTQNDTIFKHKYTTKVITNPAKWYDKLGFVFGVIAFVILLWVLGALVKNERE
jgi:hypothetical protein